MSVLDFGATPDDETDDTRAFLAALAATPRGAISIPRGRFIIKQRIDIEKADLVLRGAGPGKTVLYFPLSLSDLYGFGQNRSGQSKWSFSGAFLSVKGKDKGEPLARVVAPALRGDRALAVSTVSGINVGQWVQLVLTDTAGTLLKSLHGDSFAGDTTEDIGKELIHFQSRVSGLRDGIVTLDRVLPIEVRIEWRPELRTVAPTVSEVGIEHLTLAFPGTPYPGHFKERGYNGIEFINVRDSWVRDVQILNSDSGIQVKSSFFYTVSDVVLGTTLDRGPFAGHHGLIAGAGADGLFTRFDVRTKFIHDLTVENYAFGTVWSEGRGVDLNLDHHGRAPYGTLWTDLDLGAGDRAFKSSGSPHRMPHSAAYTTFWNLKSRRQPPSPRKDFGPLLVFVGVDIPAAAAGSPYAWRVEPVPEGVLCQENLHDAMRTLRFQPR